MDQTPWNVFDLRRLAQQQGAKLEDVIEDFNIYIGPQSPAFRDVAGYDVKFAGERASHARNPSFSRSFTMVIAPKEGTRFPITSLAQGFDTEVNSARKLELQALLAEAHVWTEWLFGPVPSQSPSITFEDPENAPYIAVPKAKKDAVARLMANPGHIDFLDQRFAHANSLPRIGLARPIVRIGEKIQFTLGEALRPYIQHDHLQTIGRRIWADASEQELDEATRAIATNNPNYEIPPHIQNTYGEIINEQRKAGPNPNVAFFAPLELLALCVNFPPAGYRRSVFTEVESAVHAASAGSKIPNWYHDDTLRIEAILLERVILVSEVVAYATILSVPPGFEGKAGRIDYIEGVLVTAHEARHHR